MLLWERVSWPHIRYCLFYLKFNADDFGYFGGGLRGKWDWVFGDCGYVKTSYSLFSCLVWPCRIFGVWILPYPCSVTGKEGPVIFR